MNAATASAMKSESPSKRGYVFISYRRSDAAGYAGRLREGLAKKFKVWQDLESIDLGTDFSAAIHHAISCSSVLLAVVGPEWLQAKDADGQMRLSNPNDYVRIEIQTALEQEIRVIPVLVGGARMPGAHEVPDALQSFAGLQAQEMADSGWNYALAKLVAAIRPVVDPWFLVRRILLGLVGVAAMFGGIVVARQRPIERSRREDAIKIARAGKVDEGLKILQGLEDKGPPDRTNPKTYLYEAEIYMMKGDAFSQREVAENAATLARRDDFFLRGRAKGLACDAKGEMAYDEHAIREAIQDCREADKYSGAAHDPVGQIRAINFKANILKTQESSDAVNPEAMESYRQALRIARENVSGNPDLLIDEYGALFNIGLTLAESKDPKDQEEANDKIEAAMKGFEESGKLGEVSNVYNLRGAVNLDQGKIEPAKADFQMALKLAIQAKDRSREAQARLNQGLILQRTGSLDDAEKELAHALGIYEDLTGNSETSDIAEVKNDLGDIYLQQGKYAKAKEAYGSAERIRAAFHKTGAQALSAASLVNADLQEGKSTTTDLLNRIEDAIKQAVSAHDRYSQSFARVIKARLLLAQDKVSAQDKAAAEKEAREALTLADDNQADNAFSAQLVLAEIEAMNGHKEAALDQLKKLQDSADSEKNVSESLEAQLTKLKIMKQSGNAKQRSDAQVLLPDFQQRAQKQGYKLLADRAQAILASKT